MHIENHLACQNLELPFLSNPSSYNLTFMFQCFLSLDNPATLCHSSIYLLLKSENLTSWHFTDNKLLELLILIKNSTTVSLNGHRGNAHNSLCLHKKLKLASFIDISYAAT